MEHSLFIHLWYIVLGIAVIAYTVLDGFDLGVGILHLFAKKDEDRRIFLNAIGPVWDGNEVWLVIIGGALFAGFPEAYATLFSGFYNLCMILLMGLVFRACAIEFRSQRASPRWRAFWDIVFFAASFTIAFGIGVALGNLVTGIPLDAHHDLVKEQFHPFGLYPVAVGLTAAALFSMHGAIYLAMKTEGELHERLRRWIPRAVAFFFLCYIPTTIATLRFMPHMISRMHDMPYLFIVAAVAFFSILSVLFFVKINQLFRAFLFSSLGIALLTIIYGIGTYPELIHSSIDPENNSLRIENAASSLLTLKVLLMIVAIGIPLVLAYGTCIYRIFRGKVKLGDTSY